MRTDQQNSDTRGVVLKPQDAAAVLVTEFFKQLKENVPALAEAAARQKPTKTQEAAVNLFHAAGVALAVKDFATVAEYLPARDADGTLHVAVPEKAEKARVYSQKRVNVVDVSRCGTFTLDSTVGWVSRIEFLDASDVVIAATGSEALPLTPPSTYRAN